MTLNGEYSAIIRIRSLVRACFGLSSALKMVVCDTPKSRGGHGRFDVSPPVSADIAWPEAAKSNSHETGNSFSCMG